MRTKIGTTSAIGGTSIVISVEIKNALLNLIFEAESTKPAIDAVTVAMMTIAGKRGGEAMAKQLQSVDQVMERQLAIAPARARLIEFVVQAQG